MSEQGIIERLARVENEVDHLSTTITPISREVHTVLERLAMINERIAAHLENTHRIWGIVEGHSLVLQELKSQQSETCSFCQNVRKVFWGALTIGVTVLGWAIVQWLHAKGVVA